jgi:thimet oligopeptidase
MKTLALVLLLASPSHAMSPSRYLKWELTPDQVAKNCAEVKKRAEMGLKAIAVLPNESRSLENTLVAFDNVLAQIYDEASSEVFLKDVAVSSGVRQAGNECATLLEQFGVEIFTRADLYAAVKAYAATKPALTGDTKRLLEKTLLDFKRNGLELPEEKRYKVRKIKQRLAALGLEFEKNIVDTKSELLLKRSELDGMPDDYIARLPREGELYKVTTDYPDYFPFMENARDPEARRRLEALFDDRAAKPNLPLLKEILQLRTEAAKLLGYKTHADYNLEPRMAKNAATVDAFIDKLVGRVKPLAKKELAEMIKLKDAELGAKSDHKIAIWDWRYYDNQLRKQKYSIDKEAIKVYFPLEKVTNGMLDVYQTLLGVKFKRVKDASVWHPDVMLYEIKDASGGEPIAYFYMDLFPREGKYKHAAAFSLISGRNIEGTYQKPVSAMVANFTKPAGGRPSLLKHGEHEEVETYFHEFGHIMHQTLTKARYARFSGSATARDFVEAPSQMLENWVWDPGVLKKLSGRYDDPSQQLPQDLLERMIAAKNLDIGLKTVRQMLFASVDLEYHTKDASDTTAVWKRVAKNVMLVPIQEGTHPEASFGHLMGYDAGYYGYMWSLVYAEDMFSKFAAEGLLNPAIGRRYREEILEVGSSRDEGESLRRFLGREPNEDAFLKSIGLK